MQTHNPFPLLASETALQSVLDDLEADLGRDHVYMLRVTNTYHRFMGYACEARLAGLPLEGPDPLLVSLDDLETLEGCVRVADQKRTRFERKCAIRKVRKRLLSTGLFLYRCGSSSFRMI